MNFVADANPLIICMVIIVSGNAVINAVMRAGCDCLATSLLA
jgi:hypothetical protein